MVGLQAWTASNPGSSGMLDDDESNTLPASPELLKQSSEMELLNTAGSLGVVREEKGTSLMFAKFGMHRRAGGGGKEDLVGRMRWWPSLETFLT